MKMVLGGRTFYFEFDRSTELDMNKKIIPKINWYINYSLANKERFYVIFSVVGNKEQNKTDQERIFDLLDTILATVDKMRSFQFFTAFHKYLIDDPLSKNLFTIRNTVLSINELK